MVPYFKYVVLYRLHLRILTMYISLDVFDENTIFDLSFIIYDIYHNFELIDG